MGIEIIRPENQRGRLNLVTSIVEPTEEILDELEAFYADRAVVDLACGITKHPDDETPLRPSIPDRAWLAAEGRTIVVARNTSGALRGVWVVKNNRINYPCVWSQVAVVLRALWDESIKHFEHLEAVTDNPTVIAAAKAARRPDNAPGKRPSISEDAGSLTWDGE